MKRIFIIAAIIAFTIMTVGCSTSVERYDRIVFAMDTAMRISVFTDSDGEALLDDCENEIYRLEKMLSMTDTDSDIYRLNENGSAEVSPETARLIADAVSYGEETDGSFDPTVAALMTAWGFRSGEYRIPSADEIAMLTAQIGIDNVEVSDCFVSLSNGAKIDLGGIAKGYTAQKLIEMIKDSGASAALLTLGGNVQLYGKNTDGMAFNIGIENPDNPGDICLKFVSWQDMAVVTSGDYQRYFESDGVRYHHIIDPETGYPADGGLRAVTVICSDGERADALSTALFVMGESGAQDYWREHGDFEMVLISDDGHISATPEIFDRFELTDDGYTICEIEE